MKNLGTTTLIGLVIAANVGCANTPPPAYVPNFGGLPVLNLAKQKSDLTLKDLRNKNMAVLPTRNTENLVPMLRQCIEDEGSSFSSLMLPLVNPGIGKMAANESARNQSQFGNPADQIAQNSLQSFTPLVNAIRPAGDLKQALSDPDSDVIAVVDLSSEKGCDPETGVPDDLNFKIRIVDKKMAVVCDAEHRITFGQAYSASTLNIIDTKNYHSRVMQGYFKTFGKHLESACSA